MITVVLDWIDKWVPLAQGFAALASIAGATLSWRFAIKARKAREQMTENIVATNILASLDELLRELESFRRTATHEEKPDLEVYRRAFHRNKELLDSIAAKCSAADPYLNRKPRHWSELLEKINAGAREPNANAISEVVRTVRCVAEELRIHSYTKKFSPDS